MKKYYQTAVIGAGVMGAALAFELTRLGIETVVLEENDICSGTSSTTHAWVLPTTKAPEEYSKLAWYAYDVYREYEKEMDIEFIHGGELDIIHNEDELKACTLRAQQHANVGHTLQIIDKAEAVRHEPVVAGCPYDCFTLSDEGGVINPFKLVHGLVARLKEQGVDVCTHTKVTGFEQTGSKITAIHTTKGDIEVGQVFVAAGTKCLPIADMVGLPHHLTLNRGFCLISERLPHLMDHVTGQVRQTKPGNLIIGTVTIPTRTDDPYDRRMEEWALELIAGNFVRDFPHLKDVNIIRSFTGIRVVPEDGFPLVGPNGIIDNLWLHVCHSGIALNPGLGRKIAEIYAGKRPESDIAFFSHKRFLH